MSRPVPFCALAAVLLTAAVSPAEPITGWTYTATLTPTGGANAVLLDEGVRPEANPATGGEKLIPYTAINRLNTGTSGAFEQGATVSVFGFASGDWEVYDALPPGVTASPHTFTMTVTFTDAAGHTGSLSADGSVSADSQANSGTGVFHVTLDAERFATIGGRMFGVQFTGRNMESGSVVEFSACSTPEPGTLALAGAGLAGVAGVGVRRRKA